MRVTVERSELADAAGWAARHLPARPVTGSPVTSGLLVDAGARLTIAAFDYQAAVTATIDAPAVAPGRALLPARLFAEIVRSLPDEPVRLAVDDGWLTVRAGSIRYRVPTLALADYPVLPTFPPPVGEVDTLGFTAAVSQVVPAAARDETFPVLTALRLELALGGLTLVATDRYRLAMRTISWQPAVRAPEAIAHVPARLLADLARTPTAASRLALGLGADDEGGARFGLSSGGRRVVVRLLDGAFPLYRRLLPDHAPLVAVAQVGAFGAAIRRVAVVAARSAPVRLVFTPGLVTAEAEGGAGDGASATDTVEVEYTGPRIAVWYNPGYLLDGLGAVDGDEVTIAFGAADPETAAASPTVLTGKDDDGFRYVLMPVVRTPG